MPLLKPFGSLQNTAMFVRKSGGQYYCNALNTKGNSLPSSGLNRVHLSVINNKLYQYGVGSGNTLTYRPYVVSYTSTGALNSSLVYSDTTSWLVIGYVIDSSGNQHVLLRYVTNSGSQFKLMKYDSSGTLLLAKLFTVTGLNVVFGLEKDSIGNLYVGAIINTTNIAVFKINSSDYTSTWAQSVNTLVTPVYGYFKLHIDNSDNIIVTGEDYDSVPNTRFFCVKFDSTGSVLWAKRFTVTYQAGHIDSCIDVDNNIYLLMGNKLVKLSPTGTITYNYSVALPASGSPDSYYSQLAINSLGNLVLILGGLYGFFIIALSRTITSGGSSTLTTRVDVANNYDPIDVICDNMYTYVLSDFDNGLGRITQSIMKFSANGNNLQSTSVNFSQTVDNGTTYSWAASISTSTLTNITVTTSTVTNTALSLTPASVTPTITTTTQAVSATTPVVYALSLA